MGLQIPRTPLHHTLLTHPIQCHLNAVTGSLMPLPSYYVSICGGAQRGGLENTVFSPLHPDTLKAGARHTSLAAPCQAEHARFDLRQNALYRKNTTRMV